MQTRPLPWILVLPLAAGFAVAHKVSQLSVGWKACRRLCGLPAALFGAAVAALFVPFGP